MVDGGKHGTKGSAQVRVLFPLGILLRGHQPWLPTIRLPVVLILHLCNLSFATLGAYAQGGGVHEVGVHSIPVRNVLIDPRPSRA
jgi:hypothetical protein